jgi:phenylpropionate dioxygenase-like ring-hydroxylating dioxygenase large terminal subunit
MAAKYLLNSWYCAAESLEVGRTPVARTILNKPIVLYRQADGTPVALDDACPHRRAPLHLGTVIGDNLRCGYHGLTFAPNGKCIWIPGQDRIPARARVRSYPICEKYGWLWLWLGDADAVDLSLLPDFSPFHGPYWTTVYVMVRIEAAALLMVDNLMDLSHVAFVHSATIGSEQDYDPEQSWEHGNRQLTQTRLAKNMEPAPWFVAQGLGSLQDQTKIITYYPYSNVTVEVKITEPGKHFGKGRFNWHMMTYDILTPETDTSCFFFGAMSRNYQIHDAEFSESLRTSVVPLIAEDKNIVEATQKGLTRAPDAKCVAINADTGLFQARRMLDELLAAEAHASNAKAAGVSG